MSNEHKRWNPQLEQYYKGVNKTPSYRPKMMLDITGRYVLESDYAALLYRIEELEADLRKMAIDYLAADWQAAEAYQAQLAAEARLEELYEALAEHKGNK